MKTNRAISVPIDCGRPPRCSLLLSSVALHRYLFHVSSIAIKKSWAVNSWIVLILRLLYYSKKCFFLPQWRKWTRFDTICGNRLNTNKSCCDISEENCEWPWLSFFFSLTLVWIRLDPHSKQGVKIQWCDLSLSAGGVRMGELQSGRHF